MSAWRKTIERKEGREKEQAKAFISMKRPPGPNPDREIAYRDPMLVAPSSTAVIAGERNGEVLHRVECFRAQLGLAPERRSPIIG